MEDFKNRVINGFAWETGARLVMQLFAWASTIWVARILTPDDYGIVAISGIFTGMALRIAGLGMGSALVSKPEVNVYEISNIFWITNFVALIVYAGLFFVAPFIAQWYGIPELTQVIRVAGILLIFSSLSIVPRSMVMRELKFKQAAIITGTAGVILTGITLVMALSGFGYWSLIVSAVLSELLMLLAFLYFGWTRIIWPNRQGNVTYYFLYGKNILASRLLDYQNNQWPIIISAHFLGKTVAGYYQMAYTLAALPLTKIGELFYKIVFPSFSRLQNDRERAKRVFCKIHSTLMLVTLPMFVGIATISEPLVELLLGEKWNAIIIPIQILCLINIFSISSRVIPRVLEGLGNSVAHMHFQSLCFITYPIVMFFGVKFGLNIMLLAWLAVIPISYFFLLRALLRELNLSLLEFAIPLWPAALSVVVFSFISISLDLSGILSNTSNLLEIVIKIMYSALIFFAVYWSLRKEDLLELYRVVVKK